MLTINDKCHQGSCSESCINKLYQIQTIVYRDPLETFKPPNDDCVFSLSHGSEALWQNEHVAPFLHESSGLQCPKTAKIIILSNMIKQDRASTNRKNCFSIEPLASILFAFLVCIWCTVCIRRGVQDYQGFLNKVQSQGECRSMYISLSRQNTHEHPWAIMTWFYNFAAAPGISDSILEGSNPKPGLDMVSSAGSKPKPLRQPEM